MAETEVKEDIEYKNPLGVTTDEDGPDDFVRVCVVLPGLKKKTLRNAAKNARIEFKGEERSFVLDVFMTGEGKNKDTETVYRYKIQQLPDEIEPENCYHKIKEGQVVLYLKKVKSRSWARELDEGGLETYEDPEENQESD